jgi:hypothetical protein
VDLGVLFALRSLGADVDRLPEIPAELADGEDCQARPKNAVFFLWQPSGPSATGPSLAFLAFLAYLAPPAPAATGRLLVSPLSYFSS